MNVYPDTSFLCAIYRTQDNSRAAIDHLGTLSSPLPVSRLLLWEFRQSVRFQSFRHRHNPALGYPLKEAEKMLSDLAEDMAAGRVEMAETDIPAILTRGEMLSRNRTAVHGHRSFDIIHVATALELGAAGLLTFDGNQTALANAEGLATPLAT